MPAIQYKYNRFEFEREPLEPVTEEEYNGVRDDFEGFLNKFIKDAKAQFGKLRNPHAFSWRIFISLLVIGCAFLGADLLLKRLGYYDAGELSAMISFVPFLGVCLQPIQWALSFSRSSSFDIFQREAYAYFQFHKAKVDQATDYNNYRVLIMRTEFKEYAGFIWSGKDEVPSQEPVEDNVDED